MAVSGDGRVAVAGDRYGGIQVYHLPAGFRVGWSHARPAAAVELAQRESRFREILERAAGLAARGLLAGAADELRSARSLPGFERHAELTQRWTQLGRLGRRTDLLGISLQYSLTGDLILSKPVSLALSVDGEQVVTGGGDGRVRVWPVADPAHPHTFTERSSGNIHTIQLADDRRLAISADWGGGVYVWDLLARCLRYRLSGDRGWSRTVSISADGRAALVGDSEGALCLWDLRAGRRVRTMVAHAGPVSSVVFSRDREYAASVGAEDNTVRLWQPATGRIRLTIPVRPGASATAKFSADGQHLFVNVPGLTAWEVRTGRQLFAIEAREPALALSGDGRVGLTYFGQLDVWDAGSGRVLRTLPEPAKVFDVTHDGRYAVTAGHDEPVRVWDLRSGQCAFTLGGHAAPVTMVMFSADGRWLLSADLTPRIQLWALDWDYEFPPDRS